jgi:hypothetical protein
MEKEQRKSLEQALAKVITDWVDFLGKDAGEKMEKPIKSAARDLMKKWNKMEKKSTLKDHAVLDEQKEITVDETVVKVKRRGRPPQSAANSKNSAQVAAKAVKKVAAKKTASSGRRGRPASGASKKVAVKKGR